MLINRDIRTDLKVKVVGQSSRSRDESKSSTTAEMADRGRKADQNGKQPGKIYVAKVVGATSSENFLVCCLAVRKISQNCTSLDTDTHNVTSCRKEPLWKINAKRTETRKPQLEVPTTFLATLK